MYCSCSVVNERGQTTGYGHIRRGLTPILSGVGCRSDIPVAIKVPVECKHSLRVGVAELALRLDC